MLNRHFYSRLCLALCCAAILSACSNTIEHYVDQTGTIMGKVVLVNSDTVLTDHSGIVLSLEGTDYTTVTDENGNWRMDGIPAQSYKLKLSHDGFGGNQEIVLHYGGAAPTIVSQRRLCRLPDCNPRLDSLIYDHMAAYVIGDVPCLSDDKATHVVYFLSNSPDVSKEEGKYLASRVTMNAQLTYCGVTRYDFMPGGEWGMSGLDPNQRIYVIAYTAGCPEMFFEVKDFMPGRTTYSSIGNEPSNVISFMLPQ